MGNEKANPLDIIGISPDDLPKVLKSVLNEAFAEFNTNTVNTAAGQQILDRAELKAAYEKQMKNAGEKPREDDKYNVERNSDMRVIKTIKALADGALLDPKKEGITRAEIDTLAVDFAKRADARGEQNGVVTMPEVLREAGVDLNILNYLKNERSTLSTTLELLSLDHSTPVAPTAVASPVITKEQGIGKP